MTAADDPPPQMTIPASNVPLPDPSSLTTEALDKAIAGLALLTDANLEVLRQRFEGLDRALALRLETIADLPGLMDEKIKCEADQLRSEMAAVHRELALVERARIELKNDTAAARVEQKDDTKAAVDAALIAQKDQVKEQTIASEKSTTKSEGVALKAIEGLGDTFRTELDGLRRELSDNKTRIERIEATGAGSSSGSARAQTLMFAIAGLIGTVAIIAFGFIAAIQ